MNFKIGTVVRLKESLGMQSPKMVINSELQSFDMGDKSGLNYKVYECIWFIGNSLFRADINENLLEKY